MPSHVPAPLSLRLSTVVPFTSRVARDRYAGAGGRRQQSSFNWGVTVVCLLALMERGAAIDPFEKNWGSTPLGAAIYAQNRAMIEFLGRVSRDIWELTNSGNIERLRELLRDDPDRAKVASDGHTPLMWLPPDDEARAMEVAKLLLAHGADPTLRNNDGETAADRAAKAGLLEVADLLNHSWNSR